LEHRVRADAKAEARIFHQMQEEHEAELKAAKEENLEFNQQYQVHFHLSFFYCLFVYFLFSLFISFLCPSKILPINCPPPLSHQTETIQKLEDAKREHASEVEQLLRTHTNNISKVRTLT
jgi:hypothetical protein